MRRALVLALACFLPAAASLAAQTIPSPYRHIERKQSVTLQGGYLSTDGGNQDLAPRSGPLISALYGIRFAGPVSGEVGLGFMPSERTVYVRETATDETLTARGDRTSRLLAAEAGLRFQITGPRTWHGFAPFVSAAGALLAEVGGRSSVEEDIPDEQLVDFGPAFAVRGSAGTDWFLTERISLRAAAHAYLWRMGIPEGLSSTGQEDSEWIPATGGTLGLTFHF